MRGVFCQRLDLESGRKLEFGNLGWGGILPKVRFGLREEKKSLEILEGVFCHRLDSDTGKKIGVWKLGGGGVLPKVRFGLREENWSLEIWGVFCQRLDLDLGKKSGVWKFGGGYSAKGWIWTQGRKLEFGNFGRGVCSVPNFRIGCSCQFGQKILEAQLAFAPQIVSHILHMWRLMNQTNEV